MFRQLLVNEWKQKLRSPYLSTSIVQKVLIGLFGLYLLANFLIVGIFLPEILEEAVPDRDPINVINGFLIYYFIFDVLTRFFMQQFPVLTIKPYLTLPVKRSSLIHFLLINSIPTFFNLLPLLLFVPFFFKAILPAYSLAGSLAWLSLLLGLILLANFMSFFLKKAFDLRPLLVFLVIALVASLFYLDTNGYITLSATMQGAVNYLTAHPYLALIPLGLAGMAYFNMYRFFRSRIYLDGELGAAHEIAQTSSRNFFGQFGPVGELMNLELKLIWRNPRARTYLYLSAFLLIGPFLISAEDGPLTVIFWAIMTTGMFAFNHAQLLLSWHSTHFDYFLTQDMQFKHFFRAKFYLLALSVFVAYFLLLPFSFFIDHWFIASTMALFFNTGIGIFLYMYIANYNSLKIDTSNGNAFNFEGFGAAHYLIILPIIGVPILIYMFFEFLGLPTVGFWVFGLVGILGLVFRYQILHWLMDEFNNRKHIISAAFRKQ